MACFSCSSAWIAMCCQDSLLSSASPQSRFCLRRTAPSTCLSRSSLPLKVSCNGAVNCLVFSITGSMLVVAVSLSTPCCRFCYRRAGWLEVPVDVSYDSRHCSPQQVLIKARALPPPVYVDSVRWMDISRSGAPSMTPSSLVFNCCY